MSQTSENIEHTLPSNRSLISATVFALIFGLIVLLVAILPAEYGIDPTGLGKSFGLTKLANPAASTAETAATSTKQSGGVEKHETMITIAPGAGLEYKFQVLEGEKIHYEWDADGSLYFDLHGEPKGDTTGFYETYAESISEYMKGKFITPFEGSHGWYWENKSDSEVVVTLTVAGKFTVEGIK